jgi:DNA-binding transcriptional LysR family regulator
MELRNLRSFVAVAEELHFSRAANRLHIAQPALSRHISALEDELGVQLIERTSRIVSLTAAGKAYLDEVRPVLDRLDVAAERATRTKHASEGMLRISYACNLSYDFIPALTKKLIAKSSRIKLHLLELSSPEQLDFLRDGTTDLALMNAPVDDGSIFLRPLFRQRLIALVPANHRLALREVISLSELAGERFIICPRYRQTGFHELILRHLRTASIEPQIIAEVNNSLAITDLVSAGVGVSIVPESVARNLDPSVHACLLKESSAFTDISIAWKSAVPTPLMNYVISASIRLSRSLQAA